MRINDSTHRNKNNTENTYKRNYIIITQKKKYIKWEMRRN